MILSIISLLVGSAIFITGMNMMSSGLKKAAGKGIKKFIKTTQNNRFACLGIGAFVTAIIQSSAATCVMAIGFINTGLMSLFQGINIMMGAYIGTTVTGILVSLSSFSVSAYFTLFAFIGVVLMFFKKEKLKNIGEILCGFGLLFFGLSTISNVFSSSIQISSFLQNLFINIEFPLLLLLIGIIFSALVQSSSATTGLVIVMVGSGVVPFQSALYIALGATIGTSITTILATIGGEVNSKRASFVSTLIKIISGLLGLILLWIFEDGLSSFFANNFGSTQMGVAMFALMFNLIFMALLSPLVKPLIRLSEKIIKDKDLAEKQKQILYIDNRFLDTPEIAIEQLKKEIFINMLNISKENLINGFRFLVYKDKNIDTNLIIKNEENIDYINKTISDYLIQLSNKTTLEESKIVGSYFHVINDIERIGDHAYNFYENGLLMFDDDLSFSLEATKELELFYDEIMQMYDLINEIIFNDKLDKLKDLHEIEEATDKQSRTFASNHYQRVSTNSCDNQSGGIYSTTLSELERIADHLTNIGYSKLNPTGDEE